MSDAAQSVDESHLGTDRALLDQYAQSHEPAAFNELSRRYAGMVYATCLRITGNAADPRIAVVERSRCTGLENLPKSDKRIHVPAFE